MRRYTERLLLRPFTEDDLHTFYVLNSDPELVRYTSHDVFDLETCRERLRHKIAASQLPTQEGEGISFAVQLGETMIGDVGLDLSSSTHRRGEIGYIFSPEFGGQGYATEAAAELLRLGFTELGLHRIIGRCYPENEASQAVMRRIGMRQEAHFVQNEWLKGEWADEAIWAILEREWRARTETS